MTALGSTWALMTWPRRPAPNPKTLRAFLSASEDYKAVGSGARYSFAAKDVAPLKAKVGKVDRPPRG